MDPDGLSILLICAAGVCALALAWRIGAVSANVTERERQSCLGFSDRIAGHAVAFLFVCGFFVYGWLRILRSPWWALAPGALLTAACVLLYALGIVKNSRDKTGFTPALLLGAPFTLPAKLVFRAAKLSAISDVTEEDLLSLVDDVEEQDLIDESQKKMITNIFELDDVTAGEIMTHRTEIVSVDENTPVGAVIRLSLKEGVSRMPVYRKNMDDVVGIIYVKDLFRLWDTPDRDSAPVHEFMRTAMFVPEACRARELLIEFKLKHTQIAVVVDEYGGTSGLVTMEDILEEIVGNIQDEFDNEEEELTAIEGGYLAAGFADLEDVFDAFDKERPACAEGEEEDFDTVGGLVTDRLGRIPAPGEAVEVAYGGILFTVAEVGERRIDKVKCTLVQDDGQEPAKEGERT